jgi:hypothetical protein
MYNINHSRSQFKLGTKIEVVQCSGLASGNKGTVVPHFNWRLEHGAYHAPSNNDVPVKYEDGRLSYMNKSRLMVK